MKKDECERAIRHLIWEWARERGFQGSFDEAPSYFDFVGWVRERGYGRYLEFRSVRGPVEDAELWFDEELNQIWRD